MITLAANNPTLGGGEKMLLELADALRCAGRAVTVVAPEAPGDMVAASRDRDFPTVALPASDRPGYLRALRRWDARQREGLLWCGGLVPGLATAGHPNRILHLHQLPQGLHQAVYRISRTGVRAVVVPSQTMARLLPGSRALPNWSDGLAPREHLPFGPVVRLGYLGRISVAKGLPTLARAVRLLNDEHPGRFRLALAGEPRFAPKDDAAAIDEALAPIDAIVDRWGWVDPERFFADTDLAVFPSASFESFGLVIAEAMSARSPFVISDAGAFPEVAGSDHPYVARAGDAAGLARALASAAATYTDAALDAAEDRWRRHYSPEAGRARVVRLLDDLAITEGAP